MKTSFVKSFSQILFEIGVHLKNETHFDNQTQNHEYIRSPPFFEKTEN